MTQGHLNQRGDLNIVALAVYIPLFFSAVWILIRSGGFKFPGYLYITLLMIIKIVAAAMTIDYQLTLNTSLAMPSAILSTVVLSPLLLATMEFLNPGFKTQSLFSAAFSRLPTHDADKEQHVVYSPSNVSGPRRHIPVLFKLNRIIIVLTLIFGIIGGLRVFGGDATQYVSGKMYMRIAAGFFIAAIVIIWLTLVSLWSERQFFSAFRRRLYIVMAFWILPLLTLRVVFTCGTAFTILTSSTQVFNPLTGSWILYMCIAWLPEILCSIAYVVVGLLWAHTDS